MQSDNDYDFITNPATNTPKSPFNINTSSTNSKIIVVLVGVIALIVIALIFSSLLSSGSKEQQATLTKIAQQQTEMIRVGKIGETKARDPSTKNLATTTVASIQSDQATLLTHIKLNEKQLGLQKNAKTDQLLTSAEQSNNFDAVFTENIHSQLSTYQKTLQQAFDQTSSKKLKDALTELFNNASTLLGQDKS